MAKILMLQADSECKVAEDVADYCDMVYFSRTVQFHLITEIQTAKLSLYNAKKSESQDCFLNGYNEGKNYNPMNHCT